MPGWIRASAIDSLANTMRIQPTLWFAAIRSFTVKRPLGAAGAAIVLLMILAALFAGIVAPYDPLDNDYDAMFQPPGVSHWRGTDSFGRDVLSRLLYGSRTALWVGFCASLFGTTLGALIGVSGAYFGGRVDLIMQRFMDILLSFPLIVLALAVVAILGVNVMPAPAVLSIPSEYHGKLVVMAMMVYAGNVEAGKRVITRFQKLAQPVADLLRPMRYKEMFPPEDDNFHPTLVARTMYLERIDRKVAETICQYLQASDSPMRRAELRVLGGAMARVPVDATAFAHRQNRIIVNLAASYSKLEDKIVHQAWVDNFAGALYQGDFGTYGNFVHEQSDARVRAIYPEPTWQRLAKIKACYDPANLFRLNQNIPPAEAVSE